MKFTRTKTIAVVTAAFVALSAGEAAPADDAWPRCNKYADTAIAQQKENLNKGCALSGPEWSLDRQTHISWCMAGGAGLSQSTLDKENSGRQDALSKCGSGNAWLRCNKYADTAIAQQKENMNKGCALSGPRWSLDRNAHISWCMSGGPGVSQLVLDKENNDRKNALSKCGSGNPWLKCNKYADMGIAQQQENLNRGCGLAGPQWSLDRNAHISWCMAGGAGVSQSRLDKENNDRQNALKMCP